MADQTAVDVPAAQTVLVCRLRHKQLRRGSSPVSGEVELENASGRVVEIEADRHPLQYLNLVVLDRNGAVVSDHHYGDIFSPLGRTYTLRLAPGERFAHCVGLLGNVPDEKRQPGLYTVRAVYRYKDLSATSEPLQVLL